MSSDKPATMDDTREAVERMVLDTWDALSSAALNIQISQAADLTAAAKRLEAARSGMASAMSIILTLLAQRDAAENDARGMKREAIDQKVRADTAELQRSDAEAIGAVYLLQRDAADRAGFERGVREAAAVCRESYALSALQLEACILALLPPAAPNEGKTP